MSKIISIGTAVPAWKHRQEDILQFMLPAYSLTGTEERKLRFLYHQSAISTRHSVIPDYSRPVSEWKFYPQTENLDPFPSLETRMQWYQRYAAPLSVDAVRDCLQGVHSSKQITHLITVSCTGMSAPGLDLQLIELLDLNKNTWRSSVNFMGCYAAIHAMKMADAFCKSDPQARVLIVCTELCTLHFQREPTPDNIASSLLFADGSAAVMITADDDEQPGLLLTNFYSEIIPKGKKDMAWELSSSGFQMTLSNYIPELLSEDFENLTLRALQQASLNKEAITGWCIHPGGKRILEAIAKSCGLQQHALEESYDVLRQYGNMSSATILFVLKQQMQQWRNRPAENTCIFGAGFGPGLTMETFIAKDQLQ
ncbi:type III polyketide synthase [Pseudoflavitalea sp. G-6-1-2]|uniref:type III polyketide synthase n=1 Tax=Pseudoflavitalea sp. G-6-1-2 TaxID=2728841 RepID=UPI00146D5C68|nr:type III polyketide synthase [Pseudoflavitalea sp. G-6-1-2]NML20639.1 type III polyketide synthase [Pseudoflavitalea sp. G-6-1-2]